MNEQEISIASLNSWRTYLLTTWYPTLYFLALVVVALIYGKSGFFSDNGDYIEINMSNLPYFAMLFISILALAGWIHLHRRVTLEGLSVNVSSVKLPFMGDWRFPLWELGHLAIGETWLEYQLGLCHINFFDANGYKCHQVSGFRRVEIEDFIRLTNEKIALAQGLPHTPLPMDEGAKRKVRRWQKIGIVALVLSILFFVSFIYLVAYLDEQNKGELEKTYPLHVK